MFWGDVVKLFFVDDPSRGPGFPHSVVVVLFVEGVVFGRNFNKNRFTHSVD